MNGTMLSQIVWGMYSAQQWLQKVAKKCQKKPKVTVAEGCLNWLVHTKISQKKKEIHIDF